jgi:hypothetical protein
LAPSSIAGGNRPPYMTPDASASCACATICPALSAAKVIPSRPGKLIHYVFPLPRSAMA